MNIKSTTNSSNFANLYGKLLGFWSSLRLAFKLMAAFGVVFILVLVISAVDFVGLTQTQAAYEHALSQGEQMQNLSDELQVYLLQARRYEKNFLLRWQSEGYDTAYANYVIPFNENISSMRETIRLLAPFGEVAETVSSGNVTREQYEADIVSLNQSTDRYEQSFLTLVEASKQYGENDFTGFRSNVRDVAHTIEAKVSDKVGLENLEITLLQMRRDEKDYLARKDPTYIRNVHSSVNQFKIQVSVSEPLQPTEKAELVSLVNEYLAAFDTLTAKDTELTQHNDAMVAAAREVEPLTTKIETLGEQLAAEDISTARADSTRTLVISVVTLVVILVLIIFTSIFLSRQITHPVTSLTNTAEQIASGDFEARAEVTTTDEIGTLAQTFNSMTSRLRQAFKEVADRSRNLATVAEISTRTTTIQDPYQMLATMVHLTQRGFNLYHAHVFTYHKDEDKLEIVACGYKEGDEHEGTHGTTVIPLHQEQSLVARAGRTRQPVIVNDVHSDPGWLPNPLLPDTRAELAVPMIVGDELVGVLDVQADHMNAFTMEDANIQMTLASEIATAYQNALSYERSKEEADLETLVNTIGQKIQRATTVEDTLQTAIREIGLALGAARVSASIQAAHNGHEREGQA